MAVKSVNAQAVEFQAADAIGQLVIIGRDQATFRTGQVLNGMERENRGTPRANPFTIETSAHGVSSIFNQGNIMALSHCAQLIHR
ncbi:hypothetical protein D3C78_1414110 [compost metagenome]